MKKSKTKSPLGGAHSPERRTGPKGGKRHGLIAEGKEKFSYIDSKEILNEIKIIAEKAGTRPSVVVREAVRRLIEEVHTSKKFRIEVDLEDM
jgi:hypothetical protein